MLLLEVIAAYLARGEVGREHLVAGRHPSGCLGIGDAEALEEVPRLELVGGVKALTPRAVGVDLDLTLEVKLDDKVEEALPVLALGIEGRIGRLGELQLAVDPSAPGKA